MASYAGMVAGGEEADAGVLEGDYIIVSWPPSAKRNKYHIVANVGGAQKTIGEFTVPKSPFAGRIPVLLKAAGHFTVAGSSAEMTTAGNIALFSHTGPGAAATYDAATREMLGAAGTTVSVKRGKLGAEA